MNFNKNYNFNQNSTNIRFGNRFRPYYRRSGHRFDQSFGDRSDGQFRPFSDRFGHSSKSPNNQINKIKPKYDTLIVELPEDGHHFTDHFLKQHFQQSYGTIKKIWFNNTKSKAFITFYNHMSVDMCVESGSNVKISGQSLKVYPLEVDSPQELLPPNGDQSHRLETLCKSTNIGLKASFPLREDFKRQKPEFKSNFNRKELNELIKVEKIDRKKLLEDLVNANHFEEQTVILFNTLVLNQSDLEKRFRLKDILEEVLNSNGFECKLHFFGSTINGLGFRDSDIDIFIELSEKREKSFEQSMALLNKVMNILRISLKIFIANPVPSIRCPIVKLDFNRYHSIRSSDSEGLVCDISLSNGLAERNSKLFRLFCQMDSRFQKMCILLRFWAKMNDFIGTNSMSSYALTHLVLFFFQTEQLLPSVEQLRQLSQPKEHFVINGWNCSFNEDLEDYRFEPINSDSLFDLLQRFFRFYANFDFSNFIISTKTGSTKHKSEIATQIYSDSDEEVLELPKESFKLISTISIEDPFELTHNLCANFNYRTFDKFCEYIISISHKFKDIFVTKPEEPLRTSRESNYWSLSCLCREWDPNPNGYVFPDYFIGFSHLDLILSLNCSQTPNTCSILMQTLANRLINLTDNWLSNVYRIDSILLSKWHLIGGYLSPFAEFYIKLRALDYKVIDPLIRQEIRQELEETDVKGLSLAERETQITDQIHRRFSYQIDTSVIPIHCHFALVMNCRIPFPTVELALIEVKPSTQSNRTVFNFLRRLIAIASNDDRILKSPPEFISQ